MLRLTHCSLVQGVRTRAKETSAAGGGGGGTTSVSGVFVALGADGLLKVCRSC